jgi:hypothetical protein
MISLASITNGCDRLNSRQDPSNSGVIATSPMGATVEPTRTTETPSDSLGNNQAVNTNLQDRASGSEKSAWMMQRGPWGLSNGLWLNLVALLLGGTGTALSLMNNKGSSGLSVEIRRELRTHANYIRDHDNRIGMAATSIEDLQGRLTSLQTSYQQLKRETAILATNIEVQRKQTLAAQVPRTQPEPPFPPVFQDARTQQQSPDPQVPWPDQQLAELTAAINRGDRQSIRTAMRAQLNITSASENAIVMGRLNETELEEVRAGGSYWLTQIGEGVWLYPTELTLKGFAQQQPSKGIFYFDQQAISLPQVVTPARLTKNGANWQIAELGSITVPS